MQARELRINGKYNFRDQSERLVYIGKAGNWHQFEKLREPGIVWSELLDSDLHLLEETKQVVLIVGIAPIQEPHYEYHDSRFNQKPEKSSFTRKINRSTKRW